MKKYICLLAIMIVLLLLCGCVTAESYQPEASLHISNKIHIKTSDLADNTQLAEGYIRKIMSAGKSAGSSLRSVKRGSFLTGNEKRVYDHLLEDICAVASGERTHTVFSYDVEVVYEKTAYTCADLHIDTIMAEGQYTSEAMVAMQNAITIDMNSVIDALLYDCPYELYWFDKTVGVGLSYPDDFDTDGTSVFISGDLVVYMQVSEDYSLNNQAFECDPAYGLGVQTALNTALGIKNKYAGSTVEQCLRGYAAEICSLTEYNYDALQGGVSYGNPWQIIWVFDGNDETNVVCEGYAKAFQYLCDLTVFPDDISVITVTGNMTGGTGEGAHMWNVVHMQDGHNYLADVTNIDTDTIGWPDQLMLAKYSFGDLDSGYTFITTNGGVLYAYDESTRRNYKQAELELYTDLVFQSVEISEDTFPDENFRAYVQSNFDTDGNNVLSEQECAYVTEIFVREMNITSLDGIQYFPNLATLHAFYNSISEIDLQNNRALGALYLQHNQLREISVSTLTALKALSVEENPISSLDISQNRNLEYLHAAYTNIRTIDTSNNELLEYLDLQQTEITELDVSHNPNLTHLICQCLPLTSIDLSRNTALEHLWISKTNITNLDLSHNPKLKDLYCANDPLTALDLSNNPLLTDLRSDGIIHILPPETQTIDTATFVGFDKTRAMNWRGCSFSQGSGLITNITDKMIRYDYDCGNNLSIEVTLYLIGSVMIDETNFPDPAFRNYIADYFGTDGLLTPEQIIQDLYIDVGNMGISSLKGIELFPNIINLYCGENPLTELNLGTHTLINLHMQNTQIQELTIEEQPTLGYIDLEGCPMKSFNGKKFPKLGTLYMNGTQISTLDLTDNPEMIYLFCGNSELAELKGGSKLIELDITGTKMTEIDLANYPELIDFNCSYTDIDELKNIQCCTNLTALYFMGTKINKLNVSALPNLNTLRCDWSSLNELDLEGASLEYFSCAVQELNRLVLAEKHGNTYTINVSGIVSDMDRISFPDDYVYDADTGTLTFEVLPWDNRIIYYYDTHWQSEILEVWCSILSEEEELDLSQYKTIILPESLRIIQEEAFAGINAEVVIIPENCASVEANAFVSCPDLKIVIVNSEHTVINENAFGDRKSQIIILRK